MNPSTKDEIKGDLHEVKSTGMLSASAIARRSSPDYRSRQPTSRQTMNLNDLFRAKGIDPQKVLVLRHRPSEPGLNKVLPWLAAEKPDVFNAYQQTQAERLEKAMLSAEYVASFIGREAGKALFIGCTQLGHQSRSPLRNTGRFRPTLK